KSSVVRLIAGALREAGMSVLAKTTGSRAALILPDGTEREVRRRGLPSVLEQKRIVRTAARLGTKILVMEMMSIREECLLAESRRLIRPDILALTNVRLDHLDLMGRSREEIAACLASAFPVHGTIILPEEEFFPIFEQKRRTLGAKLILARKNAMRNMDRTAALPHEEFEANVRLALETARELGVGDETALRGMAAAAPEFGALRIWDVPRTGAGPAMSFVNAFAANDPGSSREAMDRIMDRPSLSGRAFIGLLNLREDRGDRTLQWAEALERGEFDRLTRVAVIGGQAWAFGRRLKKRSGWPEGRLVILKERTPAGIFQGLGRLADGPAVVIGLGNIGGLGKGIVEHWKRTGAAHGV
ncbi:MAG: poly-gamma-glutamate synthase PgsB, partial [Candidatus Aminicenantes bacterium]|nr:poly-gamma-glutamate synthase PgsB [Candidatus Aminicenantes bacterium]